MKYIKGLDSLRALAINLVVISHWGLPIESALIVRFVDQDRVLAGRFGVDLFFVLSGFLITSILLQERKNSNESKLYVIRNFFVRRILRIFPIYYLFIFFVASIHYPFVKDHLIWILSYTSNILVYKQQLWYPMSHTWSLAVEEQFYLIWPWLIVFVPEKWLKHVFLRALVSAFFL
ncbi:MAG: acyltransferase [Bacteroidetes bacterium]|nr:acyltransferase [Bacteroidota bacterium]